MANEPIPVTIEYERDVISTAEGATLSAMLVDLARLVETGPAGEVFRRVYGSASERDVENLRRSTQRYDDILFGGSILLSGTTFTVDGALNPSRVINPANVVLELEDRLIRRSDGSAFVTSDFDPNGRISDEAKQAFQDAFREPLLFISEADLGEIERIAELASNIGVTLSRVDIAALPSFSTGRERDVVRFRIVANYFVNADSRVQDFIAPGDFLRYQAPRPGGANFSAANSSSSRQRAFAERIAFLKTLDDFNPQRARRPANSRQLRQLEAANLNAQGGKGQLALTAADYLFVPEWAVKRPDNFAALRVIRGGGVRSADPYGSSKGFEVLFQTNRFLIQGVSESTMERAAFVETFGPTYLYLFGTKSQVWTYNGILFDTEGMDWVNEWRQAYRKYTGGTQTAKLKARVFLTYDNVVREGIIIATNIGKTVGQFGWAHFSFQMFILKEHCLDGEALNELPTDLPTFLSEADPTESSDEQYDKTFADVTANRGQVPQGDQQLKRAVAVENRIFAGGQAQVEREIDADAFPRGRLFRTSGTVSVDATDSEVRRIAQLFANQAEALTTATVVDGRVVQRPSSRAQLSTTGSVN